MQSFDMNGAGGEDSPKSGKTAVKVSIESENGTKNTSIDSIPISTFFQGGLSFEINFRLIAEPGRSMMIYKNSSSPEKRTGVNLTLTIPDTILFSGDKWTSKKDGVSRRIPEKKIYFISTGLHKVIQGFDCIQYITAKGSGEDIIVWATDKLLPTIIPVTGLVSFPYAILEAEGTGNNKFHVIATEITVDYWSENGQRK
ncbi:MAG: hypothetical protein J0L56_03795 [Chitinophagales bacterium]|nr:hypothetical protein [Chitinophagales bacterium]